MSGREVWMDAVDRMPRSPAIALRRTALQKAETLIEALHRGDYSYAAAIAWDIRVLMYRLAEAKT